jgi:uncharacterized membrane protein YfcA
MVKLIYVLVLLLPSFSRADISLSELGMSNSPQEVSNPKLECELEDRHYKLQNHQVLGLATWGMMTATMLSGGSALDSNLHMYLGMTTGALYLATAYYSLSAPKPTPTKDKWRMKWHKGLAWVHFPLMLLVPYLGYQYKKHDERNQTHSSLEKQHAALAGILYGSFTISAALMTIEF